MTSALLWRGMLAGLLAGLLAFAFLRLAGEPPIEAAIAFESQTESMPHSHDGAMPAEPPELFSRSVQGGIGLATGVAVYAASFGGLFALVFAFAHGRVGALRPRATAALLAAAGFVAVHVVPGLKYPANPPSVGLPETIGVRTALFMTLLAVSLAAMVAAFVLRGRLAARHGGWNAAVAAGALYLAVVLIAAAALPAVNEVPDGFPAAVLWQFRIASLGSQAILWAALGIGFGLAAEQKLGDRRWRLQVA